MADVVIYSSDYCPFCMRAKQLLASKGVDFQEICVDGQPAVRAEMTRLAGGRTSVPQIWIGDTHVGGCDELYACARAGQLDALLAG
ncbi:MULTISPECIES: glutaredoxin 3 [Pseudomonadaceae]|jgi:glutaredoxin 3|uniref:Glutaredoxin n=2 Tax=Pseudomonas abyssi TaxID=170540 RepID=A0A2A3MIN3_9PSED|nr:MULTISPECIES: glutaredoxin 3 [Pseudomonadaceae]MAD01268.1 glutaredoxin 3 [Pseudomonadales bacterium]MAG65952.1 glutaredoxin 3 [Pseudomonadales bacterium]PBK04679.1 glutaredoxin 3 [Pseudomonas abyssi]RGP54087.1 glutaredoxin [Halopseudomonas gallaeciensis]|tara:strand:+ start:21215 stop:21472 length:258 start_codon:yes stop_codon:yes gene_type:complete